MDMRKNTFPSTEDFGIESLMSDVQWITRTEARSECFMAEPTMSYSYGSGRGERTYTSGPFHAGVRDVLDRVNRLLGTELNGCFLNMYPTPKSALGWHSDDFPGMDHTQPVVVLSYGSTRNLHYREIGAKGHGVILPMEDGDLLVMPPGIQHTHEHKIARSHADFGPRVSLTFRSFFPQ